MRRPSILLADDHSIVAEGVSRLLKEEFDVLGIVGDGQQLVETARRMRPDVIVADMSMPVLGGLAALRQLRAERPDVRVVFLTQHADPAIAGEAMRAGANGYVLKMNSGEELAAAIRRVLAGRVYVSPDITGEVVTALASRGGGGSRGNGSSAGPGAREDRLTPRQREVLRLVAEGKTMKEVAADMQLSRRTVEGHKYEMMQHLGVQTTAGLVRYAVQHGLVAC